MKKKQYDEKLVFIMLFWLKRRIILNRINLSETYVLINKINLTNKSKSN